MTRLLLVEDEPDLAALLGSQLSRLGFEVQLAEGLEAAVEAQAARPFDVLICDLNLNDGDAVDVARALAAPVRIGVTGSSAAEDRRRLEGAGFQAVLVKPVSAVELAVVIGRAMVPNEDPRLSGATAPRPFEPTQR